MPLISEELWEHWQPIPERTPFVASNGLKIAPTICYESVYGEFIAEFVRNGANAIFVITNDGWWGNTAGHRQHFLFSVLPGN